MGWKLVPGRGDTCFLVPACVRQAVKPAGLQDPQARGCWPVALRPCATAACCHPPPAGNFACPSIVEWAEDTVKVVYTSWGAGLKLATVKLATVDAA